MIAPGFPPLSLGPPRPTHPEVYRLTHSLLATLEVCGRETGSGPSLVMGGPLRRQADG
jgi:hypothetical protein